MSTKSKIKSAKTDSWLAEGLTDEEICESLMSELEGLSDKEWDMLGNIELTPIQQEALDSLILN